MRKQAGIALITTLLLLLLMAAMVVGFILMVTEGQRLSGMNNDQTRAFYGAEAGMEKLTADLGALFAATFAPTGAQINAIAQNPPVLPSTPAISYVDSQGNSSYSIIPTNGFDNNGNPRAVFAQISSGSSPFQGMTALETTYTLTVGARTATGAEVKLQRTTQTVGIPLFQFGIFCDGDCDYFAGPVFNFGGRLHTNGNLFLDSGSTLWLGNPVTVVKDIFRDCLENTHPEGPGGTHGGSVQITKGGGAFQALGFGQGSRQSCLGSPKNPAWPGISASFNGNLRSGVKPLNLTITLLGNGASQPIDIIRRPVAGENLANPGVLGERYFAQASLRILLSDNQNDITNLPCVSPGAPFNLADIALPVAFWATPNAIGLRTAMTAAGTTPLPLAASGAAGGPNAKTGNYTPLDGYWQATNTPVITGYIKIDAQTTYGSPCGNPVDVTQEILSLGYAGRNIDPVVQSTNGTTVAPQWTYTGPALPVGTPAGTTGTAPVFLPGLPGAQINPSTCLDPHPNAVIRLERIRDNPSTVAYNQNTGKPGWKPATSTIAQSCGVDPITKLVLAVNPSDFWPNVLFDTREGTIRDVNPPAPFNQRVRLGGVMHYIELDVNNLASWFSGAIGATGPATRDPIVAPNNFVVYVSDRRGNYAQGAVPGAWPPLSPSGNETGEYGYSDFANPANVNGCPNATLDIGEDLDQLGSPAGFFTYGQITFPNGMVDSSGKVTASTLYQGAVNSLAATVADPNCAGPNGGFPWPGTYLVNSNEARENPPALFRRALKLVNGKLINLPQCPSNVSCGLTVATENPAYIQGNYNANSANGGFADANVAASVAADALTLLSVNWNDVNSFAFPYNTGQRIGTTTWYRLGVVAGKSQYFPIPNWNTPALNGSQDFGTDGGVHNFLRYIESWNGVLNYEGSLVSMYNNRQAIGLFKCCNTIYNPPTRAYVFDTNFLNPILLPPRTPMFRDINTTGFTQLLLPNQ